MDGQPPQQTVAQAVQAAAAAAAAAAAQQVAQPSPPVQAPQQISQPTSAIDNLTCQWQGCGERCDNAEALYDHVCERHVGRKSTNNLNLTCQWGACRTTTVKRDHITSHIRVHVPLKPHKCDFCGKAFKRPQDLKKHVKTHADDSVLANSPQQGQNGRSSVGGGMGAQNGKSASSYYTPSHDTQMGNPYPAYQPNMSANSNGAPYVQPANNHYSGYGSVSYPNNSVADIQSMDTRRRAIEALNDFLGDIKRRAINPNNYYDVGQRLGGQQLPVPVSSGYNTGYNNTSGFNSMSAASLLEAFNSGNNIPEGGGLQGPLTQTGYSLPALDNARTKNDLHDIDRFLEQLQQTVYETSNGAAAVGVQHPGLHTTFAGDHYSFGNQNHYRSSNSPPNYQNVSSAGVSTFGALSAGMPVTTGDIGTPALTPASVSSYTSSGHSPMSNHSRSSLGVMNGNAMYPNLPAVTGMSDIGAGYPTTTSAPASSLATGFESLDGRRYSGGRLQRQAPGQDVEMTDAHDGNRTPRPSDRKRPKTKGNSSIDPALRGEESSDSASTPAEDKRQEDWIENIRTIDSLRKWISNRLETGDFDDRGDQSDAKEGANAAAKMAETAKMVAEKMADVEAANKEAKSGEIQYPILPSS